MMGIFDRFKDNPQDTVEPVQVVARPGVSLVKGGTVNLSKQMASGNLTDVFVGCGWDVKRGRGADYDLDLVAVGLGANGRLVSSAWFLYYGHKKAPKKAIWHSGDNLTGAGDGDDEVLHFNFPAIPSEVDKVLIAVNIYQADRRGQDFGRVERSFVRVVDQKSGTELARFDLGNDFSGATLVVFGELYRTGAEWSFRAIGQAYSLQDLSNQYGTPSRF